MEAFPYGYCGMPCALCTRFRTEGTSRCPGCSLGGYYTATCKAHHCCRDSGKRHCGACADFPCARLGKMSDFRDLNTHDAKRRACAAVARDGFDAWYAEYAARAALLTDALERFNDGRSKRYLCELFMRHELAALRDLMRRAEGISGDAKARAKAFRLLADGMAVQEP